jgi:acetoin utilization deacetylase AcuC-like enzyme
MEDKKTAPVMDKTGIYFHYQEGERLKDFPQALEGILERENVFFYDAFYPDKPESSFDLESIPVETLQKVHSPSMIDRVRKTGDYVGAVYSAAGTLAAAKKILSGEIENAFVFTGYGDHHAGSDFYGGGCYFNGAAIAIHDIKEKLRVERFAVIDTDAHHGNGSWELFENSSQVLFLCFCSAPLQEKNNNINIPVPYRVTNELYLELARDTFEKRIRAFRPELIFWNWGYDGTTGDYGDIGLSPQFHIQLAKEIKKLAREICGGRLVVILCGGGQRDLATFLIPRIIKVLAGHNV